MCSSLGMRPHKEKSDVSRRISAMVQAIILLREALTVMPALADGLQVNLAL